MEDKDGYAVYFFPPALEALGDAIKPFLVEGPGGLHVLCRKIDTAGSLIGMGLDARNASDQLVRLELMVPTNMVRMIVSARSDEAFGFGPRWTAPALPEVLADAVADGAPAAEDAKPGRRAKPAKKSAAGKSAAAKKSSAIAPSKKTPGPKQKPKPASRPGKQARR